MLGWCTEHLSFQVGDFIIDKVSRFPAKMNFADSPVYFDSMTAISDGNMPHKPVYPQILPAPTHVGRVPVLTSGFHCPLTLLLPHDPDTLLHSVSVLFPVSPFSSTPSLPPNPSLYRATHSAPDLQTRTASLATILSRDDATRGLASDARLLRRHTAAEESEGTLPINAKATSNPRAILQSTLNDGTKWQTGTWPARR